MTCDICCGSRHIRLPVHTPATLTPCVTTVLFPSSMEAAWREYPCPECSGPETAEIAIVQTIATDIQYHPHERRHAKDKYEYHLLNALGCDLGTAIAKKDLIHVEWQENSSYNYLPYQTAKLIGKIGVINPKRVNDADPL